MGRDTDLASEPAAHEHVDGAKALRLLDRVELEEHLVEGAAHARLALAVERLVAFGEVEVADEGVVYQRL